MTMRQPLVCLSAVFALFFLSTHSAAQEDGQTDNQPKAIVMGQVVGEDDKPVTEATVQEISGRTASAPLKADKDGRFSILIETGQNGSIHVALLATTADGRLGFVSAYQTKAEPVRIVVRPAHNLVVLVQDREGQPAKEAEVQFLADMRPLVVGRTNAEGRFTCQVPADLKNWAMFARKSQVGFDYATSERGRSPIASLVPLPEQVTLKLDGARTVRVKALDQNGKAVAGVAIGLWYVRKPNYEADINLSGTSSSWPVTGADGMVTLDWLPERFHQGLPIVNRADDHYSVEHAATILADNPVHELTINLLPLEKLSGRVTHSDGRPAAGIAVEIRGQGTSHNGFHGVTRTDSNGRYELKVYSEQAYLIRAGDETWASPCRSDIVVRVGKPIDGVDLVLTRARLLQGRVTVGKDQRPVANTYVSAVIDRGAITEELPRKPDDRYYYGLSMHFNAQTDADGRYQFHLGPGEYQIWGPARTEPVKLTIFATVSPAEIVQDFHMPRVETGPFAGKVVDGDGKAVPGAIVEGRYASMEARRWFGETKADEHGTFQVERSLDPLVVFARSADGRLAGILRSDAEATMGHVVVGPVATATGRLKDLDGKPLARKDLTYGIRIYQGEPESSPFSDSFGGKTTTDEKGEFALSGLVPGEEYQLSIKLDEHSSRTITQVTVEDSRPLTLGDLAADPNPSKPYVPPTPAERAAQGFAAKANMPLAERLENLLAEAQREYTRPLLLFGKPTDAACIELYRLFQENDEDKDQAKPPQVDLPAANELRWEFELAALDTDRPEVRSLAAKMKIDIGEDRPLVLAVLNNDGSLADTLALVLKDNKLDNQSLGAWMAKHKLSTRDAQQMLDLAIAKAQAEDKRVFFIVSASWCGPCRMLARFLAPHKAELDKHFVFVKLDISRDEHAEELRERFQANADGGVPWYCILDGSAKVLTTSNVPTTKPRPASPNMGFPTMPNEVEHFVGMLRTSAPRLEDEKLEELKAELLKKK